MSSNTFTLGTKSVNRLGYGAMQLAGPGVFGPPRDRHVAITVLREALALGVNHIDTSDFYGPHVTNQIIREALYPYSDDLTIVTKIGARRGEDASWLPAFSPAELQKAVHDNLRNLGLDVLDVVNLRVMMGDGHGPAEGSIEASLTVLAEMQQQGLVKHIGLSNVTPTQVAEARKIAEIVCVQNEYNIAHRADVVTSLAFKLAEMKHHGQLLRMTPQESDKVAGYLYQKFENDDDLIRVLFLALPDNLQFNFVKRMEKKSPAYFCCRDMQVIHSDAALQRLLTRFNDPEGWSNLAKNQYLSTSMKQKIWQRALSHRKNNPKADSDAYETSADMILSELISHGEVDDQMLLNATALIRSDDWDFLESALISWDNLPAVVLKELQQNTPRNDIWAKFFLRQENSSRAQVDEALRVYYALDPDALAQLDVLAKQPDRIWWSTLAKSNLTFFKFGALNNRHTPPAVLAAEIDPEWWIVAMNNPRFPVDVLKARLKRDPLLALELVNPELDLVRQLALNGKTRAIREQAMRKLDELY
ncbi:hypothetical protein F2N31_01145 [Escherichia coli]|nr:hypothetical protein [Escherichia coli]